ncbi:hypothetical protein [Haloarchaeobius sp. DYHT-AS-18]|uniref:hypothetical protein n=1 Tax=Haloarchaeobius sp. DYHT-AS-18 TaxID=3446117 RepID=UPI003EB86349
MPIDTGWDLPATTAVSFDPPAAAIGVSDADAFRDAYAVFFRRELATNLERDLDNDALHRIANRLKTLSWRPAFAQYDHPNSADELTDLTRLVQAYARAGADLRPSARPDYWAHDGTRDWVEETVSDCEHCEHRELSVVTGEAIAYHVCEGHHREAMQRFVEATRTTPAQPHPDEPFDLAERLDAEELPTDAAHRLAEIGAYDPHAVRPVTESLLRAFESQRGAVVVSREFLHPVTTTLTHLGTIDGRVRERFVASLADDDAPIRQASAAAVASLAWERPDALLSVDDGVVVPRLVAMLDEDDPDSRALALSALREFARSHAHVVEPYTSRVAAVLDSDAGPAVRFLAGITLANLTLASPVLGARRADRFETLACGTGAGVLAGLVGLYYLDAAGYDVQASLQAAAEAAEAAPGPVPDPLADPAAVVRWYADPTRHDRRTVREAVYALGHLGGPGELDYLDWVDACARDDALRAACEAARDRLFVT